MAATAAAGCQCPHAALGGPVEALDVHEVNIGHRAWRWDTSAGGPGVV